jgi:hypothetical protein
MFTQIMWFYVMGLTTPFQIRSYVTTCGARIELMRIEHTQKVILLVIWGLHATAQAFCFTLPGNTWA